MKAEEILSEHKLKRTSCREGMIELILKERNALSENEIRDKLEGNYDRSTFYRSFKTLLEKNILHKIVIDNQIVKYALDNSLTHKKNHAHFYCNKCNVVKCLENIEICQPKLPNGYKGIEAEVIIKGFCNRCN